MFSLCVFGFAYGIRLRAHNNYLGLTSAPSGLRSAEVTIMANCENYKKALFALDPFFIIRVP